MELPIPSMVSLTGSFRENPGYSKLSYADSTVRKGKMKTVILFLFIAFELVVNATMPPPEGIKEKPIEESWDEASVVVYGQIVKLEALMKDGRFTGYIAHLEPRRLWKGKASETYKILVGVGPSQESIVFDFLRTYVAFLGDEISLEHYEEECVRRGLSSAPVEFVDGPPFEGLFPDRGDSRLLGFLDGKEELKLEPAATGKRR